MSSKPKFTKRKDWKAGDTVAWHFSSQSSGCADGYDLGIVLEVHDKTILVKSDFFGISHFLKKDGNMLNGNGDEFLQDISAKEIRAYELRKLRNSLKNWLENLTDDDIIELSELRVVFDKQRALDDSIRKGRREVSLMTLEERQELNKKARARINQSKQK